MNGKQVIRQLRLHGFELLRVRGSHYTLAKGHLRVQVPVHGASDLKIGTLKSIEKQSGVKLT